MKYLFYRLEHGWRRIMTVFCFAVFGFGGVLLSLIWFNGLFIFCRDKALRIRTARWSVCYSFRLFLLITRMLGVLRYKFNGIDKLGSDRGCLILANHPTLLDYVLIAAVIPEVDCLVKSSLLKNPFVSGVIRACDYLPNDHHETLLAESRRRLKKGSNLLIFPEGTRTTPGVASYFQRGAANIALRCDCSIRLIHIHSSEPTLNKQSKMYDIPNRKLFMSLTVGDYFELDELIPSTISPPSIQVRKLTKKLETLLI